MKSTRGIYYDLNESTYIFEDQRFILYFSSQLYLNNFKKRYKEYIDKETKKLNSYYKCEGNYYDLLFLSLYKKIEKRGFRAEYKINYCIDNFEIDDKLKIRCNI